MKIGTTWSGLANLTHLTNQFEFEKSSSDSLSDFEEEQRKNTSLKGKDVMVIERPKKKVHIDNSIEKRILTKRERNKEINKKGFENIFKKKQVVVWKY